MLVRLYVGYMSLCAFTDKIKSAILASYFAKTFITQL